MSQPDDPYNSDATTPAGEHGFIGKPVVNYNIIFEDESELRRWQEYLRWLKKEYPSIRTIGQRIDRHITDTVLSKQPDAGQR